MSAPWMTVIGVGESGETDLTPAAKALVDDAEVLVGGERHHGLVPRPGVEQITWTKGMRETFADIALHRGKRVVVLASGDPFCFGVATTLLKFFEPDDLLVYPSPSAFSLACARLKWSLPDTACLTVHGRPVEALLLHFAPRTRFIALSRDGRSPREIAALLTEWGFGPSRITVLEHMGGDKENRLDATAATWGKKTAEDLNVVAVEVVPGPAAKPLSLVPGLPDKVFENDGQLTKREVRAATLSALQPLPGQTLWDVGAGCGSIAIEWLRALEGRGRAVAVEQNAKRRVFIGHNAMALGVPSLEIVDGEAPEVLEGLSPQPDAIFLGGGVSTPGLLDACWAQLPKGGRLVANGVTLEAERALIDFVAQTGGALSRFTVERLEGVGRLHGFKPMMTVTQLTAVKS